MARDGTRFPSREAIAKFVDYGDPSGLTNAEAVLDAVRSVTVCDPACGSGAYLLGIDFGDAPVFKAITYPTIVILERTDITRVADLFRLTPEERRLIAAG